MSGAPSAQQGAAGGGTQGCVNRKPPGPLWGSYTKHMLRSERLLGERRGAGQGGEALLSPHTIFGVLEKSHTLPGAGDGLCVGQDKPAWPPRPDILFRGREAVGTPNPPWSQWLCCVTS